VTTPKPRTLPYGAWPSLVSAVATASAGVRLGWPIVDGDDVYWVEGRPQEGGRQALVRWRDSRVVEMIPAEVSVHTRVHEYGGGAYAVSGGTICYSSFADGRLHRLGADGVMVPLTPPGPWHFADLVIDRRRRRVVCVREDRARGGQAAVNALVTVPLDGGAGPGAALVSGDDFYSSPRLSPDASRLCWLSWSHPRMPWNGTELWVADLRPNGTLAAARCVAGGDDESIYQPGWTPDGALLFASDRDDWWTLYRWREGEVAPVLRQPPPDAEFGRPAWTFGTATWAPAGLDRLVAAYTTAGRWHLASIDCAAGTWVALAPDLEPSEWIAATPTHAVVVAGAADTPGRVLRIALVDGAVETLRVASDVALPVATVSVAEAVTFPTSGGRTAHVFYYPPVHAGCTGPSDERPPLIVVSHGGPTAAASAAFSLRVQFWTTRGFAVADVNYGGSSGFGRAYRQRLDGAGGVVDVEDCVAAARWLVSSGRVDANRLIIRGGSAGGYTTLAALAFRPEVFKAGASYYGVSDLEALARDTHKFEARYIDSLIGSYPEARDIYRRRSPLYAADSLSCPLILFQGLEDEVVPPNQSALMAEAVRAKGLPVAYLKFAGEQHGFRRAETIVTCLEAELYFYGKVFGFAPADPLPEIPIANL
jgi:dipeptidyl aminopeptidase/acylaminoacyl peptidase